MKKIFQKMNEIFHPKQLQGLDSMELLDALNDPAIRKQWLYEVYEDLKRMNLEADYKLRVGERLNFDDLCSRRKAYQSVLEAILSAKGHVRHNLAEKSYFDFDAMTA